MNASSSEPDTSARRTQAAAGAGYALGAYLWWGGLPLYFVLFTALHPIDTLAWRIIFSLVVCLVVVAVIGLVSSAAPWRRIARVLATPRDHALLVLASVLIGINWGVYIYAATSGQVLAASLGYFINPLATIALGVIFLREKLRWMQWAAVGLAVIAVMVLTVEYGRVPWISLALAGSFSLYGLVKNQTGKTVNSLTGLTVENMWLTVPAVLWIGFGSGFAAFHVLDTTRAVLLTLAGVVTVVPLLFFASASSRLALSAIGMFQFITPILQFLLGYFLFGEEMSPGRWAGFGLVWVAVAILASDMARVLYNQRRIYRNAQQHL